MAARRKEKSVFDSLYETFAQHFAENIPPMEPMADIPPMGESQPFGFVSDIREWMGQLGRNALPRFGVFMISHGSCEQPVGQRSRCGNRAVAECVVCGTPTCLFHGFVNHEATLLCEFCADWAATRAPRKKQPKRAAAATDWRARARANGRRDAPPPPPPKYRAPRNPNYDPERVQALTALGLPPNASMADVHARFRELAKTEHPDKFPEHQRAEANRRFSYITAAYELLKSKEAA